MPDKLLAVIWDMDGVIADTGAYHFASWQYAFQNHGATFTTADFQHEFGRRNDAIVRDTLPGLTPEAVDAVVLEKENYFRNRVAANVKALPGAIELLKALNERGIKNAIASSSPLDNIRLIIGKLGILDCFQAFVFGREVKEGKPSPQIYLLAAQKLGAAPENSLVIEDAVAGVTGAKRGGMKCLAVTNTHPRESLKAANLIVDSLASVTVSDLEKLFERKKE